MKSSTIDNSEGKMNQMKGKIKEFVGNIFKKSELEAEGKEKTSTVKMQDKVGESEKVDGKQP